MTDLQIGDRVSVVYSPVLDTPTDFVDRTGTIAAIALARKHPYTVDFADIGRRYFSSDELMLADAKVGPEYVHVIESRQIWVTLPGDTAGHKLSEDEARTLFHQLEAIL